MSKKVGRNGLPLSREDRERIEKQIYFNHRKIDEVLPKASKVDLIGDY